MANMTKLFQTPFGFFIYDAHVNKFAKISKGLYDKIRAEYNPTVLDSPEVKRLCLDGFFQSQ